MKYLLMLLAAALVVAAGITALNAQDWNIQIVDDVGSTGFASRIGATSDGIPYILYQADIGVITLAWWVASGGSGGWDRISWGDKDGYHLNMGLEVDAYDHIHIAYTKMTIPYQIKYGIFDHATKSWVLEPEVALAEYGDLALALRDSSGTIIPSIVWSQRAAPNWIMVATRDPVSETWYQQAVYDLSETDRPSIAIDSAGKLHVSFYETLGANLMYATNAGGTWISEYVDNTGFVGSYSAIVIDAGDIPYIVYYDQTNTDLKYAKINN